MMTNWITLVCLSASGVEVYFALHDVTLWENLDFQQRDRQAQLRQFFAPIIRSNYQITPD